MIAHAPAILDAVYEEAVYEERVGYGWIDGEDDPSPDDLDPAIGIDPVGWC